MAKKKTKAKKTKAIKTTTELTIKKIKNGYTISYYEDKDYEEWVSIFCADREDVINRINEVEF